MPTDPESIICHVRSLPAEARAAYLDQACAGNAALRAQLETKLAELAAAEVLFAGQETILSPSRRAKEEEGHMIGPYKLLQQIGEGGFGTVWMAEQQQPVRRRVALKIIKAGMDTKQVTARFEQERQALAMMDHPNIAQVFDAGATETGRPYFVMELVKGIPITRFCDERKLGTRERLLLFADVCSAINHAHQKGIIHRDIKPTNVMVTLHGEKAVPKVIDFGIAKATQNRLTEMTIFTRFEQFVGTPVYMSPEQAALSGLDIDTRSDIYALGILLYELLTGRPPFDQQSLAAAGYDEMRRIIREVEPPKPSARLSTVAGDERTALAQARHISPDKISRLVEPDLDWIVMKAIEKDRTRRYETANAFALDIQRFLADEPVSASPPGAGYLLKKFARRYRKGLRVAAVIALLLVAGTVISTLLAIRATRAEQEATKQLEEKEVALEDAEEIVNFLTGILESPDPRYQNKDITVAASLDRAALVLESSLASQPARQMKIKAALGRAYVALGRADKALPIQEQVRDYHAAHGGTESAAYIKSLAELAWTYDYLTRRDEAIPLERAVLRWHEAHHPAHPDTSAAMAELGRTLWFSGHRAEGLALQDRALTMSQTKPGPEHPQTIMLMHWVAVALAEEQDAASQERARRMDAEQLRLSTKVLGEKHPETLRSMTSVASHLADEKERLKLREKVAALSTEINGAEHRYTLAVTVFVAKSLRHTGAPGDAARSRQMLEAMLPHMEKVNTPRHDDTLWVKSELAGDYANDPDPEQKKLALKMRDEVAKVSEEFLGAEHHNALGAKAFLACSHFDTGDYDAALWQRKQILPLIVKNSGADSSDANWVRSDLTRDYLRAERWAEAIPLLEETLRIRRAAVPENKPKTRETMKTLALALRKSGRPDDALKLEAELGVPAVKHAPGTDIVPATAKWKWRHPADGKDPGLDDKFADLKFDDSAWQESAAQGDGFGYGPEFSGVDIGTPEKGQRFTAYFRCRFDTSQPLAHLELRCQRDDGLIVYLDGKEVLRDNMEAGADTWQLCAKEAISPDDGATVHALPLPGELAPGPHVLAISVHNVNGESSDLRLGNITLVEVEEK